MNRTALGLAIGAGYVLGRTKKMKLAIAVGTMVAGKRLNLSPSAIADMARTQLANNPQFKEVGDQLRDDLRGVGKAASGALVERQIEGLAGRLHSRTQGVRDQIEGVVPDTDDVRDAGERVTGAASGRVRGRDRGTDEAEHEEAEHEEEGYEGEERKEGERQEGERKEEAQEGRRPAAARSAKQPAAKKAPAKKRAVRPQGSKTTAAKKTAAKGGRSRG
ncbi:DNA primase [Streptomyces sp. NPDC002795]|uniref:DNA primase n=1 Tax=Streptomyces sp. NPDC002795 TaxID=3364665 RepID=UPI0036CB05AA